MRSFRSKISPLRRSFLMLASDIHDGLASAFAEEQESRGLTKANVAETIGRHKSFVTRKLSAPSNMSIQTLAYLAHAMGRRIVIKLEKPGTPETNWSHELSVDDHKISQGRGEDIRETKTSRPPQFEVLSGQ